MQLIGRTIWQVAAGDGERAYHDLLIHWDVIAIGPGEYGPWPDCEADVTRLRTAKQATIIRRFAEDMAIGDLIILRKGSSNVCAVGEVASEYLWLDDFGDVDGWDLQHVRRVRWLWKYKDLPSNLGANALRFGDSVQAACSTELRQWLDTLEISKHASCRELAALPDSCQHRKRRQRVSLEQLTEELFDRSVGLNDANVLIDRMRELEMLSKWYKGKTDKPAENETVAYLVVPLLRAFGWTPQRMAVEWKNIDVALFSRLPRSDDISQPS